MYSQLIAFSLVAGFASSVLLYFFIKHFSTSPAATLRLDRVISDHFAHGPEKVFFWGGSDGTTSDKQDERVEDYEPALKEIPYEKTAETPVLRRLEEIDPGIVSDVQKNIAEHRYLKSSYYLVGLLHTTSSMNSSDIGEMISEHPILADKIMKTANSSYYCLLERVESIERAVSIVGHDTVMEMIVKDYLSAKIVKQLHLKIDEFNWQWCHAIAVSACAKHLNSHVISWDGGNIFSITVFHDIGKLFFPLIGKTGNRQGRAVNVIEEENLYGINHSLVGGLLGTDWQLPEIVTKCIEYHHNPQFLPPDSIPAPYLTPCFIICLADLICGVLGYGGAAGSLFPIRDEYFALHGLSSDLKDIVTPDMIREIDQACRQPFALRSNF